MVKVTFRGWKAALIRAGIALAAAGTIAYMGYAMNVANNVLSLPGCAAEIKPKHSRKQIEEIVAEVKTPVEAVARLQKDIEFSRDADTIIGCISGARFMSMQESYALGKGDCMDGAIAFAALLSDNPEYEARAIILKAGHAIAVYKDNGKWGFVSFNDYSTGVKSIAFQHAVNETMGDAIAKFCNGRNYTEWAEIKPDAEDMNYGRALQNKYASDRLLWQPVRQDEHKTMRMMPAEKK